MEGLNQEKVQSPDKGKNVHMTLKFMRHGLREPTGELTEYGKEITRKKARESKSNTEGFNVVGAMGSDSGPKDPTTGMERSLETAHIYAVEIESDKKLKTGGTPILGYATLPEPFGWDNYYNSHLPENFDTLPDDEKNEASKVAQTATVNHLMSLQTPDAIEFRREIAGSFARVIDHYKSFIQNVNSNTRALLPQGTHGGKIEPFLKETLIRHNPDGYEIHGFEDIEEIGGAFDSSEAFNVEVATDNNGDLQKLKVTFDNKDRPQDEMYLDLAKLQELKDYYRSLHSKKS